MERRALRLRIWCTGALAYLACRGRLCSLLPSIGPLVWLVALMAVPPTVLGSPPPPRFLSETGLYVDGSANETAPGVLAFSPQYPLWSDGTTKRRWIFLPAGSEIDAARPAAWEFPVGTRLWKEFTLGQRIETRLIERLSDGSWRFSTYLWKEDGSGAELAPAAGIRSLPVVGAPGGRYAIPSRNDCLACHEGAAVPVLGFSALQLSPDRDPSAPHAEPQAAGGIDLRVLVERGLLRNLPAALIDQQPRIQAASADQRAALGYLHANCGHCHNDPRESGSGAPVDLLLAQYVARPDSSDAVVRSLLGASSRYRPSGGSAANVAETLAMRMRSRDPRVQMPPLGTRIPDSEALSLIQRWLSLELKTAKESRP